MLHLLFIQPQQSTTYIPCTWPKDNSFPSSYRVFFPEWSVVASPKNTVHLFPNSLSLSFNHKILYSSTISPTESVYRSSLVIWDKNYTIFHTVYCWFRSSRPSFWKRTSHLDSSRQNLRENVLLSLFCWSRQPAYITRENNFRSHSWPHRRSSWRTNTFFRLAAEKNSFIISK